MSGPIDNFVASGGSSGAPNAPNSRYYCIPTATVNLAGGRQVRYLQRRLIPQPEQYATLRQYVTIEGDRIDTVTNPQLGDPLLYWILCYANGATNPDALTAEPGRVLRVTLPAGICTTGTGNRTGGQRWLAASTSRCSPARWSRCRFRSR